MTTCTEGEFLVLLQTGGTITFTQDCSITLSATIPILLDTTIDAQGHQVTFSGGNRVQMFRVNSSRLTGIGLTLSAGTSTNGGAFYVDSSGSLVLTNCTLAGNIAVGTNGVDGAAGANTSTSHGGDGGNGTSGFSGFGGAICNLGAVMLENCRLSTNSATGGNGGAGGAGGSGASGILSTGGNGGNGGSGASAYGGAIYNLGNLTITNCTFSGNTATAGDGGAGGVGGGGTYPGLAGKGGAGASAIGAAICNSANLNLSSSTFSGNKVQGGTSAAGGNQNNSVGSPGPDGGDASGGGVYNGYFAQVVNCTFYNNSAAGGTGGNGGPGSGALSTGGNGGNGGKANGGALDNAAGTLGLTNCTIVNCGAAGGTNGVAGSGTYPGSNGHPGAANGGGIANLGGTLILANSILATNLTGTNAFGTIVAGGYNLSSDNTPASLSSASRNKNPLIGSLANNGGPTQTIALTSTNSPAYAQIPDGTPGLPTTDQRGVPRPAPGKTRADIGACEFVTAPGVVQQPVSVTQTNGGSATFYVSAAGDGLIYRWHFTPTNFYYGTNIVSSTATNYPWSTASNLTFASITITNTGNYFVEITNRFGKETSSVVTLTMPPFIAAQPTNTETGAGADAIFMVVAAADQPLAYQWYSYQTNALLYETNWIHKVRNAQLRDDGMTFTVVVTNSLGSVTSVVATLTVDAPPAIVTAPTNQTVTQGGEVHFLVGATGTQPLSYQWRFNGSPKAGFTATDCPVYNAQTNNSGYYDVVVTNRFGSVTSTPPAYLQVQVPFQPPLSITAPSLAGNSLSFAFPTVSGFTYTVEYKNQLTDINWIPLASYPGTGGSITSQDPTTNQPGRFYRVRSH